MKFSRVAIAAAAVAVLAGGGYTVFHASPPPLHGVPLGAVRQPSPMVTPSVSLQQPSTASAMSSMSETAEQRDARAKARYAEVDGWMRSGTPEDALKAYKAAYACTMARGLEVGRAEAMQGTDEFRKRQYSMIPTYDETCLGLSPGQLAASTRLLIQAGEAGLHDAYVAVYYLASSDPALAEARERIQMAAVAKGDTAALTTRASEISDGCRKRNANCTPEQLAEALTYRTAAIRVLTEQGNRPPPTYADISQLVARVGNADKADAAIARGEALARATGGVR